MAIIAASVEANGWVLRLTLTGTLSSGFVPGFNNAYATPNLAPDTATQWATNFAGYALAPSSGAPALTLAMFSTGFVQSGGQAAPSTVVGRALIGTRALRKVVDATAAGLRRPKEPDEVDNGDGTVTVRIALSQHVYAGDTGLSLTALAGWRTGATAQTIAVTNNSTVAAPAPIVRWTDVPYQLQPGSFALEVAVASHHPNGLAPVAAVKFTVTDGTTIKTFWATALSTSTAYSAGGTGQGLRVYAVTVDPTTATALTKGLLRCDFKVFPWIGPARSSDTADTNLTAVAASNTPSMTNLPASAGTCVGLATAAQTPFVVAYNPANAWITPRFIDIDAVNGTTTAASVTIGSTAAAAAAGTPAADIKTAMDAVYAANVTINDGRPSPTSIARSADGLTLTIRRSAAAGGPAGSTGIVVGNGQTADNAAGCNTGATFITVRGDPGDGTGRACILRAQTSGTLFRYGASSGGILWHLTGLSVEAGSFGIFSGLNQYAWFDNVEVRGASGQTTATAIPFAGNAKAWVTATKWWQHGTQLDWHSYFYAFLVRNTSVERTINAPAVFNCARLPGAATVATPANNRGIGSTGGTMTDAGFALDRMVVGCDLRYLNGAVAFESQQLANASAPANLTLGKNSKYYVASRCAWLNNVAETFNGSQAMWGSVGENNATLVPNPQTGNSTGAVATENIIEGNTFTGDRTNAWYNLGAWQNIALNDSEDNLVQVNRLANNALFRVAQKHDRYYHPSVQAQRIGVALSATRSKTYAVGDDMVIAGSPANVYRCTVAGTTAASGGPAGTATGQVDGSAAFDWIATETRQHGFRPQATGAWSSAYGVMAEGNIDLANANDGPAQSAGSTGTYAGDGSALLPDLKHEFFGVGSQSLTLDGISLTASPFTSDLSGGQNRQPYQAGSTTGGGDYRPLGTSGGTYILARARTASVDVDQRGVARTVPFAAGALAPNAYAVAPGAGRVASAAAAARAAWTTTLAASGGRAATRAAATTTGWRAQLAPPGDRLATRAAASGAGWTVGAVPNTGRIASAATAARIGWGGSLAVAGAVSASRAGVGQLSWRATLVPSAAAHAGFASDARAAFVAAPATLAPRAASQAVVSGEALATFVTPDVIAVDPARLRVVDATLFAAAGPAPPERTLFVRDQRTTTVS